TIVAFQNSVERREIGIASGLATFTLNLGGAIGVSLLGAVQISLFASDLAVLLAGAPSGGAAVLQEAFAQSISSVFWIVLGVSVATFFAVLLMKRLAAGGAPANPRIGPRPGPPLDAPDEVAGPSPLLRKRLSILVA